MSMKKMSEHIILLVAVNVPLIFLFLNNKVSLLMSHHHGRKFCIYRGLFCLVIVQTLCRAFITAVQALLQPLSKRFFCPKYLHPFNKTISLVTSDS